MKLLTITGAVVLALALGACSSSKKSAQTTATTASSTTAATPNRVTVQVGINDPDAPQVAVLQFMPAAITVPVGETVHWSWDGTTEPHTVTFLAPGQQLPTPDKADSLFAPGPAPSGPYDGKAMVNSGLQPSGPAPATPLDMSFANPGTFVYHCVIHPQMVGKVTVVAAGQTGDTASAVKDRGDGEKKQWLAEGEAALKKLNDAPPASTKNSDGTTTWRIQTGASTPHTDVLAFAPVPATVKAGDKVTFVNTSTAPHTASFFNKQPAVTDPGDPKASAPSPGPSPQTLNLTDYFNTGVLPPDAPPGAGPPEPVRSFTFVAKTAGIYSYVCIFHAPSRMAGSITVT